MAARLQRLLSSFAPLLLTMTTGCTNSLDLGRFHHDLQGTSPGAVTFADLKFVAKAMRSHLNEYLELRIVDRTNSLQAKAVYQGVTSEDFSLNLAKIVPKMNGPYRIDFWADHNSSGKYDGIEGGINEKDHAWRRVLGDPLPEDIKLVDSRYEFTFQHDTVFIDIATDLEGNKISLAETLLPLKVTVTNASAYVNHMMELRVVDRATGRLNGLFRQGTAAATFDINIAGILDEETGYDLSLYADSNDNNKYDVGVDPSWMIDAVSTSEGIIISADISVLPPKAISTGEPPTP